MQTSRRRQPQRIPPPIRYGEGNLDAEVVLREIPGDLALLLWKTVRSIGLWGELPPEEREGAFPPEALESRLALIRRPEVPAELHEPLERAARALAGTEPPEEVAEACRRIADWAEARGATGTALELLQAAAAALPGDATLPYEVASLARRRAEFARAETWYRQAIFTARRTRDRGSLVRAYTGLGVTHVMRGGYPAARQAFLRGLRAARRHSLHELAAGIYHHLAAVAIRTEQKGSEVERYARAALEGYGAGHFRLPALAHDLAVHWMNRGYFAAALPVFQAIPPDFGAPRDRLVLAASRARAAGGVGDRTLFDEAWEDLMALLQDPDAAERAATALVELAHGAASLGEWDRAERAAERAFELARERGEGEKVLEAETLLESVRRSRRAKAPRVGRAAVLAPRRVQSLASELVARLPAGAGVR